MGFPSLTIHFILIKTRLFTSGTYLYTEEANAAPGLYQISYLSQAAKYIKHSIPACLADRIREGNQSLLSFSSLL